MDWRLPDSMNHICKTTSIGGLPPEWWDLVIGAWIASNAGDVVKALSLYDQADSQLEDAQLNGALSVLRHNSGNSAGMNFGSVLPIPATETKVVSLFFHGKSPPPPKERFRFPDSIIEKCIERFIEIVRLWQQTNYHWDNIAVQRQHIMVLSTGRCGTRALYELFCGSNLMPYHTYWFTVGAVERWEMACRLHAGDFSDMWVSDLWAATRAAEWLGEKSMIGLNHTDTIFAPAFAAIHPKAKFVYLHRNEHDVLRSFIDKKQWSDGAGHLPPLVYDICDGEFHFGLPEVGETAGVKHHLQFTASFCRAFGNVMGDRFLEISADKLFAQDREEVAKLLEFTGSDIDLDAGVEHFGTKINEKRHKL